MTITFTFEDFFKSLGSGKVTKDNRIIPQEVAQKAWDEYLEKVKNGESFGELKHEDRMKIYFKGDSGITNPMDIDGNEINEGDILSYDYGDHGSYTGGKEYPEEKKNIPVYIVKKNEKGGFFGEGIKDNTLLGKLFLHDFRFKYTKKLNSL